MEVDVLHQVECRYTCLSATMRNDIPVSVLGQVDVLPDICNSTLFNNVQVGLFYKAKIRLEYLTASFLR
jgi:hypothetical protein